MTVIAQRLQTNHAQIEKQKLTQHKNEKNETENKERSTLPWELPFVAHEGRRYMIVVVHRHNSGGKK